MRESLVFITYSQNFEDVMLWRALKHVERGFYIDVGAWLPETDSVTKAFYDHGWTGINIEPDPIAYMKLVIERPCDINLQIAVSDYRGYDDLYLIKDTGLSTLREDIANMHAKAGYLVERVQIPVKTLNDIWEEYIHPDQHVHFLKIDVEGVEEAVLRGNDWLKHRPWIIVVEATLPTTQQETQASWEQILLSAGYHFAYADGLNRFYVADEHQELIPAFKYPPNIFDNFKLSSLEKMELQLNAERSRASHLESELDAERSRASQLENELHTVYSTRSWRLTQPLRAAFCIMVRMRSRIVGILQAVKGTVAQMVNRSLIFMIRFVTSHSSLKYRAVSIVKKSRRLDEWAHRFVISHGLADHSKAALHHPAALSPELEDLSLHARCIYINLKDAIERSRRNIR